MLTLTSPVEIWAHRWPAGRKLALLALATTGLFLLSSPLLLCLAFLATLGLILTGGAAFLETSLRLLRPLWPFLLIVALWHLWTGDLAGGTVVMLRMVTAVALANFVTMTTRLSDMILVFQWLARPLQVFGLSSRRLALAFALVIRFIPVMLDRVGKISESWRARSPGNARWRVLVPATLAALDDADRVAEALRARGGAD
ncbi:MAG: energy-coupling factor transporter transmembrane protein EcfT [Tabrizicola sp.]|jgi:biotin transport system permease protein|nr:energy-coupling factor transporter transmembrane protein EcfT [Tabrizicola sp.]